MWIGRNLEGNGSGEGDDSALERDNFPVSQSQISQFSHGDDEMMDYLTPQEPSADSQSYPNTFIAGAGPGGGRGVPGAPGISSHSNISHPHLHSHYHNHNHNHNNGCRLHQQIQHQGQNLPPKKTKPHYAAGMNHHVFKKPPSRRYHHNPDQNKSSTFSSSSSSSSFNGRTRPTNMQKQKLMQTPVQEGVLGGMGSGGGSNIQISIASPSPIKKKSRYTPFPCTYTNTNTNINNNSNSSIKAIRNRNHGISPLGGTGRYLPTHHERESGGDSERRKGEEIDHEYGDGHDEEEDEEEQQKQHQRQQTEGKIEEEKNNDPNEKETENTAVDNDDHGDDDGSDNDYDDDDEDDELDDIDLSLVHTQTQTQAEPVDNHNMENIDTSNINATHKYPQRVRIGGLLSSVRKSCRPNYRPNLLDSNTNNNNNKYFINNHQDRYHNQFQSKLPSTSVLGTMEEIEIVALEDDHEKDNVLEKCRVKGGRKGKEIVDLSQNTSNLVLGFTSLNVNNNHQNNQNSNTKENGAQNCKSKQQIYVKGSQSSTDECTTTPDSIDGRSQRAIKIYDEPFNSTATTTTKIGAITTMVAAMKNDKTLETSLPLAYSNESKITGIGIEMEKGKGMGNEPDRQISIQSNENIALSAFKLRTAAPREMYIDTPLKNMDTVNFNTTLGTFGVDGGQMNNMTNNEIQNNRDRDERVEEFPSFQMVELSFPNPNPYIYFNHNDPEFTFDQYTYGSGNNNTNNESEDMIMMPGDSSGNIPNGDENNIDINNSTNRKRIKGNGKSGKRTRKKRTKVPIASNSLCPSCKGLSINMTTSLPTTNFVSNNNSNNNQQRQKREQRETETYDAANGRFGLPISRYLYDFEEINLIGSGQFSTVHQVRKRMDGWCYAIKKSKYPLLSSLEEREKLMEVYAHAALSSCPSIINYYDAWFEEGYLYLQLELCAWGSLESLAFHHNYRDPNVPFLRQVTTNIDDDNNNTNANTITTAATAAVPIYTRNGQNTIEHSHKKLQFESEEARLENTHMSIDDEIIVIDEGGGKEDREEDNKREGGKDKDEDKYVRKDKEQELEPQEKEGQQQQHQHQQQYSTIASVKDDEDDVEVEDRGENDEIDPRIPVNYYANEPELLLILQQVSSALEYMHEKYMVHLDVKPGNILVYARGVYKVGDFGHTACLQKERYSRKNCDFGTRLKGDGVIASAGASTSAITSGSGNRNGNGNRYGHEDLNNNNSGSMIRDSNNNNNNNNNNNDRNNINEKNKLQMEPENRHQQQQGERLVKSKNENKEKSKSKSKNKNSFIYTLPEREEGDNRYISRDLLKIDLLNKHDSIHSLTTVNNILFRGDIFALGISLYEIATQKKLPSSGLEWHQLRDGDVEEELLLAPYPYPSAFASASSACYPNRDLPSDPYCYYPDDMMTEATPATSIKGTAVATFGFGFSFEFVQLLKSMMNEIYEERPPAKSVRDRTTLLLNRYSEQKAKEKMEKRMEKSEKSTSINIEENEKEEEGGLRAEKKRDMDKPELLHKREQEKEPQLGKEDKENDEKCKKKDEEMNKDQIIEEQHKRIKELEAAILALDL